MAKTTPKVVCNASNDAAKLIINPQILVGTPDWFDWVEVPQNRAFMFEPCSSTLEELWNFSVQKEERKDGFYWYGYKRFEGKLQRHYLGQGAELSLDKLLDASRQLMAKFHNSSTTKQISVKVMPAKFHNSSTLDEDNRVDPADAMNEQLTACRMDCNRLAFEKQRLEADQQTADAAIKELRSQISALEDQLSDQAGKAGEWYDKAKAAQADVEQLRSQLDQLVLENSQLRSQPQQIDPEVITLLTDATTPKSKGGSYAANNATGLKKSVEQALKLLTGL